MLFWYYCRGLFMLDVFAVRVVPYVRVVSAAEAKAERKGEW